MASVKVKKNDAFEFLEEVKYQSKKGIEDKLNEIIKNKPFDDHKFYIFCFQKDNMKGNMEKTLFMQPRLTKPKPVTNSMLFRADPRREGEVEVIWILPGDEYINLFKQGKVFEDPVIQESIEKFVKSPWTLSQPTKDDLPDWYLKEYFRARSLNLLNKRKNSSVLF